MRALKVSRLESNRGRPCIRNRHNFRKRRAGASEGTRRLFFFLGFGIIAVAVSFLCSAQLIKFLQIPIRGTEIYQTLPGEFAFASLSTACWWSGLTLGPLFLTQIFLFYIPGLYVHELSILLSGTSMALLLFLAGCVCCYTRILPSIVAFFSSWGAKTVSANWTLATYTKLVFLLSSFTYYLLQIPLLQVLGVTFGGLTGAKLLGLWRGVSVGLVTLAAIITPSTDAWIQGVISVYLIGIYFLGTSVAILSGG